MPALEYCTSTDVSNFMPVAARTLNGITAEIAIWMPVAQVLIDDMLAEKYIVTLEGAIATLTTDTVPKQVRYATAFMTVSLLLVNSFTEHNYQFAAGDKTVTLAQTKESQARKIIKEFMDKKGYYDTNLKEQIGTRTLAKVIKGFESDNNDDITDFMDEIHDMYS